MLIQDITEYLESLAPLALQEDYDNAGLQSGVPHHECTGALLCLEVTPEVVREATVKGCNLIISHHPLIFKGLKNLVPVKDETRSLVAALKSDIALYAIHTNLDNVLTGLNGFVLNKLGVNRHRILKPAGGLLRKLVTFCPVDHAEQVRKALFDAGAGHIGNYDCCSYNTEGKGTFRGNENANPFVGELHEVHQEPETRIEVVFPSWKEHRVIGNLLRDHPYEEVAYDIYTLNNRHPGTGSGLTGFLDAPADEEEFLLKVKNVLKTGVIRHTRLRGKPVGKVAICTGSGGFLISDALRAEADIFLTADLKHHDFFIDTTRMIVADIGHYESEQWVKEWLHSVLVEKFPNFAFPISEVNTNPVQYL